MNNNLIKVSLIRHGKTKANEDRLYCGSLDPPLSKAGKEELIGLKEKITYPEPALVITSGFCRTEETAELLYGRCGDVKNSGFAEMNFGIFEGYSYEQLKNKEEYRDWIMEKRAAPPGGESRAEFRLRVLKTMNDTLNVVSGSRARSVAVLAHGGVIVTIMEHFFPGKRHFYEWQPEFGRGYCLIKGDNVLDFSVI